MKTLLTIFLLFFQLSVLGQNVIKGKYNPDTKTFETKDKSYWIDVFQNGVARISKDGYAGVMDSSGKILLEAKYDAITHIDDRFIKYAIDGKRGTFERTENKLIDLGYYIHEFYDGIAKFTEDGETFGFINESKEIIVPPFKGGRHFSNFIGGYSTDGFVVIDKSGKQTTLYNNAQNDILRKSRENRLPRTQGYFLIPKVIDGKQKFYYLNGQLERISDLYFDDAYEFVNNHATVKLEDSWGILDTQGTFLITDYKHIQPVENGTFIVHSGSKFGVVNAKNDTLLSVDYGFIKYLFDDLYSVTKHDFSPSTRTYRPLAYGGFYVMSLEKGKVLPEGNYYEIEQMFSMNLGIAFKAKDIINLDAGYVFGRLDEYKFTGFIYFFDNKGLISEKGYFIETDNQGVGRFLVEVKKMFGAYFTNYLHSWYRRESFYKSHHVLSLKKENNRLTIVELEGFDGFLPLGNERFIVTKNIEGNSKFGLANIDGEVLIPLEYDEIKEGVFNVLPAKKDGKWGAVNYQGKTIAPFIYEDITIATTGMIAVKNGKYGFIDLSGKEIIPFIYDAMSENKNIGRLNAQKEGERPFRIDKKGERIK